MYVKASKAQVHIFIRLFSQLSVIHMKLDLKFSFILSVNPSLCIINIRNSVNKISSFFFQILCTPCCIFKRYKQTESIESVFSNENWNAEHLELVHGKKKNDLSLHNVPMFFSMFCTKKMETYMTIHAKKCI